MGNDDDTPSARPRRHARGQTGTERDIAAERRLAAERAFRTPPRGTPIIGEGVLIAVERKQTDELDALPRTASEMAETWDDQTGITERIAADPDMNRLFRKVEHTRQTFTNRLLEAMGTTPPAERMSDVERKVRRLWWVATAVLVPVVSVVIAAGHYLVDRTAKDERAAMEREQLIQRVVEQDRRIRELEDRAQRDEQHVDDLIRGRGFTDRDLKPDNFPRNP